MTDKLFDSIAYFKQLCEENKTCRAYNFVATTCSGPDSVQGVMQQFRKAANFIMSQTPLTAIRILPVKASSTATSIRCGFSQHTSVTTWRTERRS